MYKNDEKVKSRAGVPIWIFIFLALVPFAIESNTSQLVDMVISICLLLIATLICLIDKHLSKKWFWEEREKKKKKKGRLR